MKKPTSYQLAQAIVAKHCKRIDELKREKKLTSEQLKELKRLRDVASILLKVC